MYLFDFDGTLVDSNGVWVEIDNGFLARRGLTPTREYSDTVGHSIFPIAAQFTKDYYCLDMTPEAIMAEWLDMARDAYARQVPMKPGAEAFLARCAAAGEPNQFLLEFQYISIYLLAHLLLFQSSHLADFFYVLTCLTYVSPLLDVYQILVFLPYMLLQAF